MRKIQKLFLLIGLLVLLSFGFTMASYAFEPRYTVHTSLKDIGFKKNKALKWYQNNVDGKKFYWYDANKQINWLKNRVFKWNEDKITNNKFYFVHTDTELGFTKNKALRWFERNSS